MAGSERAHRLRALIIANSKGDREQLLELCNSIVDELEAAEAEKEELKSQAFSAISDLGRALSGRSTEASGKDEANNGKRRAMVERLK